MELKKNCDTIRMMVKGGVLTPSYFLKILDIARKAGNSTIGFGSRQDIIFNLPIRAKEGVTEALKDLKIEYGFKKVKGETLQNIVSSFVSADILASTQWLNSGNYIQILDLFTYKHQLRINITDPKQSLVPLFYGHINFVASPSKHYWFVYLRLPESKTIYKWPALIYTTDIPVLAQAIEESWLSSHKVKIEDLASRVMNLTRLNQKPADIEMEQPKSFSADYEGFGRMHDSDKYWAGLIWRNNRYDISFLEKVCRLSLETGISKIAITPWKSFIVKDIQETELIRWQILLGSSGITMRHSAFDLNWHLPLHSPSALRIKQHIVKTFDNRDVCVHGLTFGITDGKELPFCSVMIREYKLSGILNRLDFLKTYDILVADHFNPNSCQYHTYLRNCSHQRLAKELINVTKTYYTLFEEEKPVKSAVKTEEKKKGVFQCPDCFSVYLPQFGCPDKNIPAGTPFKMLPKDFCCPVCDTGKDSFVETDLSILQTS